MIDSLHGKEWRRKYLLRMEARNLIKDAGGMDVIISSILGEPVDVDQTLDGDPILVRYHAKFFDRVLGVRLGDHIVLKSARNVLRIDLEHGIMGWRA